MLVLNKYEETIVESVAATPELNVEDAEFEANKETGFQKGDAILSVRHLGGDPIDWSELTLYVKGKGTDNQYLMTWLYIVDVFGSKSQVGDIILLGIADSSDNGAIEYGDYLLLVIKKGSDTVWSSANAVKVT